MNRWAGFLALAVLMAALSGCSFWQKVSEHSVRYNQAVEKAHNELFLLNILRAKDRRPMYFTAISQLKGSLSGTVGGGNEGTIGGGTNDVVLTPGANYTSSPSYDVAVLDSESFMRGFLSPVALDTLQYYLNQGWPADLLVYLLVEKIETRASDFSADVMAVADGPDSSLVEVWKLTESNPLASRRFQTFAEAVGRDPSIITIKRRTKTLGPPLPRDAVASFGNLLTLGDSDMTLDPTDAEGTSYQLSKAGDLVISFRESSAGLDLQLQNREDGHIGGLDDSIDAGIIGTVTLRSPQGVIYFLGEQARLTEKDPNRAIRLSKGERLFVVHDGPRDASTRAYVEVEFDGQTYFIPHNGDLEATDPQAPAGRSMQCLSLVSQLISLQKKASELPRTSTVTVVGG